MGVGLALELVDLEDDLVRAYTYYGVLYLLLTTHYLLWRNLLELVDLEDDLVEEVLQLLVGVVDEQLPW